MLASEACPFCHNRIEGKPTAVSAPDDLAARVGRLPEAPPRWRFECFHCQYEWMAEPVSPSLMLARPELRMGGSVGLRRALVG